MDDLEDIAETDQQINSNRNEVFEIYDVIGLLDEKYKDAITFREQFSKYFKDNKLAELPKIKRIRVISYFSYRLLKKENTT